MLIECAIRRKLGTHQEFGGVMYDFMPIVSGEHVAEVTDRAAIKRFLSTPGYREHVAKHVVFQPIEQAPTAPLPALVGTREATPLIESMDREQMMAYAGQIGMRTPHPAIGDEKLRANIAAFLELRAQAAAEFDQADEGEGDQPGDETGDETGEQAGDETPQE